MVRFWRAWCPIGWKCGKNNKQLCKKRTYDEAFSCLQNHLTVSCNHATLSSEEREKLLQSVEWCVCEDEKDAPDDEALKEHDDDGDGSYPGSTGVASASSPQAATNIGAESRGRDRSRSRTRRARDSSRSRGDRVRDGSIVVHPTVSAPPPPPVRHRVSATGNDAALRIAYDSLRRAETSMTHASQVAVAASVIFATEKAYVGRAIKALEQYLARG